MPVAVLFSVLDLEAELFGSTIMPLDGQRQASVGHAIPWRCPIRDRPQGSGAVDVAS